MYPNKAPIFKKLYISLYRPNFLHKKRTALKGQLIKDKVRQNEIKSEKYIDLLADVIYDIFSGRQKGGVVLSPRTGRPPIENPMSERITVRLDAESAKILKEYCQKQQIEKAEAIRRGIKRLADMKK